MSEVKCQFINCEKLVNSKITKENYMYCEKHSCVECAKLNDSDEMQIWRIYHFKHAHFIRDAGDCCVTACGYKTSDIIKFHSDVDYCNPDMMCQYDYCEAATNSRFCENHKDFYCRICKTPDNQMICLNCYPRFADCGTCRKIYPKKFIVTTIYDNDFCLYCYTEDKYLRTINLKYVDNKPQVQNVLDYNKLLFYYFLYKNRTKPHIVFTLPYDIFLKILSYTELPPSYISLESFLNYLGNPTEISFFASDASHPMRKNEIFVFKTNV